MLNFGTDINQQDEQDLNEDLFSGQPANETTFSAVETAENTLEKSEKTEIPEITESRRAPVKPPVLPQYKSKEKKKTEKPKPELTGNPYFLHRNRKSEEFSVEDKLEVSRILKAARTAAGLTPEDVEHACAIRPRYLTALENGNYDELPQPVYVLAFLRKLCQLYDIPEDEENLLVRPWRNIPFELPENLSSIQQDEDPANKKMLHLLEIALLSIGAIIVLGIIALIIVLISSHISGKDAKEPAFENVRLLELQKKPALQIPEK